MAVKDAEHQLNVEISENESRKDFSKAERIDYARRLERIESLKAEKRMKIGKVDPMETFPQGTTRDIVASKLGIGSGKQYEKEKYIADNRDSLTPEGVCQVKCVSFSKNMLQFSLLAVDITFTPARK